MVNGRDSFKGGVGLVSYIVKQFDYLFHQRVQILPVHLAVMETFNWLVEEMNLKVEWRSALEEFGEQCALTIGIQVMQ